MSGGSRSDLRNAIGTRRGAAELVVLVFEDHPQRVADGGFVIDDEDAGFHRYVDLHRMQRPRVALGLVDVERQDVAGLRVRGQPPVVVD